MTEVRVPPMGYFVEIAAGGVASDAPAYWILPGSASADPDGSLGSPFATLQEAWDAVVPDEALAEDANAFVMAVERAGIAYDEARAREVRDRELAQARAQHRRELSAEATAQRLAAGSPVSARNAVRHHR